MIKAMSISGSNMGTHPAPPGSQAIAYRPERPMLRQPLSTSAYNFQGGSHAVRPASAAVPAPVSLSHFSSALRFGRPDVSIGPPKAIEVDHTGLTLALYFHLISRVAGLIERFDVLYFQSLMPGHRQHPRHDESFVSVLVGNIRPTKLSDGCWLQLWHERVMRKYIFNNLIDGDDQVFRCVNPQAVDPLTAQAVDPLIAQAADSLIAQAVDPLIAVADAFKWRLNQITGESPQEKACAMCKRTMATRRAERTEFVENRWLVRFDSSEGFAPYNTLPEAAVACKQPANLRCLFTGQLMRDVEYAVKIEQGGTSNSANGDAVAYWWASYPELCEWYANYNFLPHTFSSDDIDVRAIRANGRWPCGAVA